MKKNIICGVIVASSGVICALWLLIDQNKLSGAEFVALSLGFSVVGLIIAFANEVQEFSIAGNGVKLKELRSEAEKTIEELKLARIELFRILVNSSIVFSGGFGSSSKIDERAQKFIHLFNEVKKFNLINDLQFDLEKSLKNIMIAQYNNLSFIHKTPKKLEDTFTNIDKPQFLYIGLNEEVIKRSYHGRSPEPDFELERKDIIEAISIYADLYQIKTKLEKNSS